MPFSRKLLTSTILIASTLLTTGGLPAYGQPGFFEFFSYDEKTPPTSINTSVSLDEELATDGESAILPPHDEKAPSKQEEPLEKMAMRTLHPIRSITLTSAMRHKTFHCDLDDAHFPSTEGEELYLVRDRGNHIKLYQNATGLKEGVSISLFLESEDGAPHTIFYNNHFPHSNVSDLCKFHLNLKYSEPNGQLNLRTSHNYLFLSLRFLGLAKKGQGLKNHRGIVYFVNQNILDSLSVEKRFYANTVLKRINKKSNFYTDLVKLETHADRRNGFIMHYNNLPNLLANKGFGEREIRLSHINFFGVLHGDQFLCSRVGYNAPQLNRAHRSNRRSGKSGIPINIKKPLPRKESSTEIFPAAQVLQQVLNAGTNSNKKPQSPLVFMVLDKKDSDDPKSLPRYARPSIQRAQTEENNMRNPAIPTGFSETFIDGHDNNCLYRAILSSLDPRWREHRTASSHELRNYLSSELETTLLSTDPQLAARQANLREGMAAHFIENTIQETNFNDRRLINSFLRVLSPNTAHPFAQEVRKLNDQQALTYIREHMEELRDFLLNTPEGHNILRGYMNDHLLHYNGQMETAEAIGPILAALFQRRIIVHIANDPEAHLYGRNQFGRENDQETHIFYTTYKRKSRDLNHYNLLSPLQSNQTMGESALEAERSSSHFQKKPSRQMAWQLQDRLPNDQTLARKLKFSDEECLSGETLTNGITPPDSPLSENRALARKLKFSDEECLSEKTLTNGITPPDSPLRERKVGQPSNQDRMKEAHDAHRELCEVYDLALIGIISKREEILRKWKEFQRKFPFFEITEQEKGLLAVLKAFVRGNQSNQEDRAQQLLRWKKAEKYLKFLPEDFIYWVPYQIAFLEDSLLDRRKKSNKQELERILKLWKEAESYENKMTDTQKIDVYMGIAAILGPLKENNAEELEYLRKAKKYSNSIGNLKRKANLLGQFAFKSLRTLKKDETPQRWAYLKEAEAYEEFMDLDSQKHLRDQLAHIGGYLFQKDPTTMGLRMRLHERALELNPDNHKARHQLDFLRRQEAKKRLKRDNPDQKDYPTFHSNGKDNYYQDMDNEDERHRSDKRDDRSRTRDKGDEKHRSDKKDDHSRTRDKGDEKHRSDKRDDRSRTRDKGDEKHGSDRKDDRSRTRDKGDRKHGSDRKDDRYKDRDKKDKDYLRR